MGFFRRGDIVTALIERDDVFKQLFTALQHADLGNGNTVLLFGEAGIGKTSVLTQFISNHPDCRVLSGGCEALYSPRPLGPLYDMAHELDASIQQLIGLEGNRAELFSALLDQLQNRQAATIMVIEDLHWADTATLDLVKFLTRRIHLIPTLLLLTFRDDELGAHHPLRSVLGDMPAKSVTRIPLAALSENAVVELARQASCNPHGIYKTTGGNPFFVTEAIRGNTNSGTVRDAVMARLSRLPDTTLELINLISIVPTRIEIALVAAVLGPKQQDVLVALSSGLVKTDGRFYFFRHELARISVEETLAVPIAVAYHARILDYLIRYKGHVAMARLVHHAAGAKNTEAVLRYAPQAAAEAKSCGSHREAAELYGVALLHAQDLGLPDRAQLYEQRAYMCYLTDQIDDAIEARLAALSIWGKLENRIKQGHTMRWLSRLHWFAGNNDQAKICADLAVQILESQSDPIELAWAQSNLSQLYMLNGNSEEAIQFGNAAIQLAKKEGDSEILIHALNNVGTTLCSSGQITGKAMLQQSLQTALELDYREHAARAYVNLVSTAVSQRDYRSAREGIEEGIAYFAERDLDSWLHYLRAYQIRMEFEMGNWDAAAELASQVLARKRVANISRIPILTTLARVRNLRGDPGGAELLGEATVLAQKIGELQRLAPVAIAHAEAAWLANDAAALDQVVYTTYDLARQRGDKYVIGELAFWFDKLELDDGATTEADLEPAYDLYFSGNWKLASETAQLQGRRYESALFLMAGDESNVNAALSELERLGASALIRRCRCQVRQAGLRGVIRGPRATTAQNFAGLTARELQILLHLTEGRSNAEIASQLSRSEKTVEHHVSAILFKLKVKSRGEAVALANKIGR
ncbi:DNA-binding CsgD family transcriptional regulator/tetratricopeptide (TPR) repeat protein [Oxalobacteraceae bacterium GrIS 1.18]